MSHSHLSSPTQQILQPSVPSSEHPHPKIPSPNETNYTCTCGRSDTSSYWICCDNTNCPIGWYHWECVSVIKTPLGKWFCPRCTPQTPPKAGDSNTPRPAKKGIAIKKKSPAKRGKSKWVGWVELGCGDEDEDEEEGCERGRDEEEAAIRARKTKETISRATQAEPRATGSGTYEGASKRPTRVKTESTDLPRPSSSSDNPDAEEDILHGSTADVVETNPYESTLTHQQRQPPQDGTAPSPLSFSSGRFIPKRIVSLTDRGGIRPPNTNTNTNTNHPRPSHSSTTQAPTSAIRSTLPRLL